MTRFLAKQHCIIDVPASATRWAGPSSPRSSTYSGIIRCDVLRTSRKSGFRCLQLFALVVIVVCSAGCQFIWEDLARRPYEDAVRNGRMSPGEYRRMRDQIEQAANNPTPPPSLPRLPTN